MVSFADLRDAETSALYAAGQAWWRHGEALRALEERMNDDVAGGLRRAGWEGDAADVAVERSEAIEGYFDLRSYAADLVAGVYDSAYDELWRLKWRLTVALDQATTEGLSVTADGVVRPPPASTTELHDPDGQALVLARSRRARELTDEIAGIVSEADAVDQRTADALALLGPADGQVGPPGWAELVEDGDALAERFGISAEDIPDDPAAAAAWWGRLSEAERARYLTAFPTAIGDQDGLPAADRDRANQLGLLAVLAIPIPRGGGYAGLLAAQRARKRRERARTLLDRLEAAEHRPDHQRLYLLGFRLEDDGQAVVAVGNPDTADHTAVYIPGVNTTIDSIGGDIDRMRNLQREADRLTAGRTGDVATVMWLGYDTPGTDLSAVRGHHAESGAPRLDSFTDGLRAAHDDGAGRLTVIGHSYGSAVVGTAASDGDGLAVDDIVVAGSPGMRVDNVADLRIDPRHVWAGAADGDQITGWLGNFAHGPEPHEDGFGANRYEVDTTGHSDYWRRGTDSLENQAAIVAGHYAAVTLEHGEPPR